MSQSPGGGPAGSPTPRWFHLLIGVVGILIGGLYLFTAFTSGPLARNLIFAGIWGGMGMLWLLVGFILPGAKGQSS